MLVRWGDTSCSVAAAREERFSCAQNKWLACVSRDFSPLPRVALEWQRQSVGECASRHQWRSQIILNLSLLTARFANEQSSVYCGHFVVAVISFFLSVCSQRTHEFGQRRNSSRRPFAITARVRSAHRRFTSVGRLSVAGRERENSRRSRSYQWRMQKRAREAVPPEGALWQQSSPSAPIVCVTVAMAAVGCWFTETGAGNVASLDLP